MRPRPIAQADLDYWAALNPRPVMFTAPGEVEAGIEPCLGLMTDGDEFGPAARVPWTLDEIELAHLARGGTLWLSTWGALPPHMLEVQAP